MIHERLSSSILNANPTQAKEAGLDAQQVDGALVYQEIMSYLKVGFYNELTMR